MKPNGIFYISAHGAAVVETQAFLKQRPRADLATQSGPMLVIDGRLHPRFDRRSTSLKARTGVGVRADGKVIFAVSAPYRIRLRKPHPSRTVESRP